MLNQLVLVGRLTRNPEVSKTENGTKYSHITLAVPRSYKNSNGEYETDFIDCTLFQIIATNTKEYCKKGDIVGIKGRLESSVYEKDGIKKHTLQVVAEKVTFLSSNSKEHDDLTTKEG